MRAAGELFDSRCNLLNHNRLHALMYNDDG